MQIGCGGGGGGKHIGCGGGGGKHIGCGAGMHAGAGAGKNWGRNCGAAGIAGIGKAGGKYGLGGKPKDGAGNPCIGHGPPKPGPPKPGLINWVRSWGGKPGCCGGGKLAFLLPILLIVCVDFY